MLEVYPNILTEISISLIYCKNNCNICVQLYIFIEIFHRIPLRMIKIFIRT